MPKILEVIVTSVEEAIEAEAGGADRLELVRDLEVGGLTPELSLVEAVLDVITVPVRVMLRLAASMSAGGVEQMCELRSCAQLLSRLPIDGLVAGFMQDESIDLTAMSAVVSAAPQSRFTFHRAFDELRDPLASLEQLKCIPQVDRILTVGGAGDWAERRKQLLDWQKAAVPSIEILVGAGLSPAVLEDLRITPELREIHIGRAARARHCVSGPVEREAVRRVRSALQ